MLSVRKRGRIYRLEGRVGEKRVRLSLGTRNQDAAILLANKIERALVDGKGSKLWGELFTLLPPTVFRKLAAIVGRAELPQHGSPTWETLRCAFAGRVGHLIARGRFRESSWARYRLSLDIFSTFLAEQGITKLEEINRRLLEEFKAWRLERILANKHSRGGGSLDLDLAILHRIFVYAIECELVQLNPVKTERKPGARPELGAQPFTADELGRMRDSAGEDLLIFLLLRHTGLRRSDAVDLRWKEIDWRDRGINRVTQKRSKRVWIPLHPELAFALEAERERRQPGPDDWVLLNPSNRKPMKRMRLYFRLKALGRRARVHKVHPHRFRDTFTVDLLLRGASPYDIAKLLGDTIQTVEIYYAPFVRELRERTRRIMVSGKGLEEMGTLGTQSPAPERRVH